MDVERSQRGHDDEVREDERPAARPRPPEATTDVGDPDADLDRERTRQGLADRDPFPHLLLGEPFLFADHLALHLSDERDRTAEADEAEAQVVADELANRHAVVGLFRVHSYSSAAAGSDFWSVTLDRKSGVEGSR